MATNSRANSDTPRTWPTDSTSRVPSWVYVDPDIYAQELERIFYGPHWNYVALEAELPAPFRFKTTRVGERSVIVVRDKAGEIHVLENRCAHRGVAFMQERAGEAKLLTCPYHQWCYSLNGELRGLPFRAGVDGAGGMPEDFQTKDFGLRRLKVARRHGVIFASFDETVQSFEDYLGEDMLAYFDRVYSGRGLRVLGYSRQRIPGNWKLMMENIKDPYHPGLLHTWFVTFGLWRADQDSKMRMDGTGRHACMISSRNRGGKAAVTEGVSSFKENMTLHDARLLDIAPEPWWGAPSVVMQTVFPSVILQQQVNSLSVRQIQPHGPGAFDFVWTHFGFEDDSEEMTERRLRQANLFGPAGFVSADDGEVIELAQSGLAANQRVFAVDEMDGRGAENADHMVTEALIRGMYRYWREVMEI